MEYIDKSKINFKKGYAKKHYFQKSYVNYLNEPRWPSILQVEGRNRIATYFNMIMLYKYLAVCIACGIIFSILGVVAGIIFAINGLLGDEVWQYVMIILFAIPSGASLFGFLGCCVYRVPFGGVIAIVLFPVLFPIYSAVYNRATSKFNSALYQNKRYNEILANKNKLIKEENKTLERKYLDTILEVAKKYIDNPLIIEISKNIDCSRFEVTKSHVWVNDIKGKTKDYTVTRKRTYWDSVHNEYVTVDDVQNKKVNDSVYYHFSLRGYDDLPNDVKTLTAVALAIIYNYNKVGNKQERYAYDFSCETEYGKDVRIIVGITLLDTPKEKQVFKATKQW